MSTHDFRDLRVVHEHPANLGGLVGTAHPALDPQVRATGWARPRKDRRKIPGTEPDQRVVRIEGGDNQFTDLAIGARGPQCPAERFPRSRSRRPPFLRAARSHTRSNPSRQSCSIETSSTPRCFSQARAPGGNASPETNALRRDSGATSRLVRLLDQRAQEARGTDIAGRAKVRDRRSCSSVLPTPAGKTVQPSASAAASVIAPAGVR